MSGVAFEACVETLDEARAAEAGGAARVELCANLHEHGTTPPGALLAACVEALTIPVFAMVRPRAGSSVYSSAEADLMRQQAARARALGARGIVAGALTAAGAVDVEAMRGVMDAAGSLPVTFHRAFDVVADHEAVLETLMALGVARVLTSGGAATAIDGCDELARLVRQAAGRILIVAGGGVRAHNVRDIVARTGVVEVHAHVTSVPDVRALVQAANREG